jgi:hypothetical protein
MLTMVLIDVALLAALAWVAVRLLQQEHGPPDMRGVSAVRGLMDESRRDEALKVLMNLNGESDDGKLVVVNHVVECPQPSGEPIYAVFKAEGYELKEGGRPGKAIGHVMLFTSEGRYVPFWKGANSIHGTFADINGDRIVENVEPFGVGVGGEGGAAGFPVKLLLVLPIVRSASPMLMVAYDLLLPRDPWSYELADVDGDGIAEIQLGPSDDNGVGITPAVTYRWSAEKEAYLGPDGGTDEHFIRVRSLKEEDLIRWCESMRARRRVEAPADPEREVKTAP